MPLPHFLVVGTQKAATTSLHFILKQHPQVFLPASKEVHFFDSPQHYEQGEAWYAAQFSAAGQEQKIGDITPSYMLYPEVPERIKALLGAQVRLIFLLRQPAERAWSQFIHLQRTGQFEATTFEAMLEQEQQRMRAGEARPDVHYSLIRRGLYAGQIERFLKHFPIENMLFLLFREDFVEQRETTVAKVLDFIEVEPMALQVAVKKNVATVPRFPVVNKIVFGNNPLGRALPKRVKFMVKNLNKAKAQPSVLPESRQRAITQQYFEEDIRKLEKLINRDLSRWL